jgi:hypothetical protein
MKNEEIFTKMSCNCAICLKTTIMRGRKGIRENNGGD